MKKTSEIEALKKLYDTYEIHISVDQNQIRKDLFFVNLCINQKSWSILINDEYLDYCPNRPLVNWFLVLSALEMYQQTNDFLIWCKQNILDASESKWLTYYKSLAIIYQEIETKIGCIDSCISHHDYNLRTGAIVSLLK